MTKLSDLVVIDYSSRGSAIRLDDGLTKSEALVDAFTPTHSSVAVLLNTQKAVLANASQQSRAMIWHGVYGSGKSHLGVLIGELLRRGTTTGAMRGFLDRLRNLGQAKLADAIKTTFHPNDDPDARPYLIVTLYGSPAPTLQNALLEGLYLTLRRTPGLDPERIIPKTEFAAARERLTVILELHPAYRQAPLSNWQIQSSAFNLEELENQLIGFDPDALEAFRSWHPKVSAGAAFDPQALGGKGVTDAFAEAAALLTRDHSYNGIAVIWDEFGYALDNLIRDPLRNPIDEIHDLQKFVETVCTPSKGHTLFIGLTHRSLREYGSSSQAGIEVKNYLELIEGRFINFPVALKNSEAEGYHLLSAMVARTPQGQILLERASPRAETLVRICARMPLFTNLASDLKQIVTGCYPLHPLTAAGLFAIAAHGVYSQASRTVFTFYQNLEFATAGTDLALEREVDPDALYGAELIRLPELLTVYRDDVFNEYPGLADAYHHAIATVTQGFPESFAIKRDIVSVLLLARVLGDQFQPTDALLSAALYDTETDSVALKQELEILQRAGLIWRRETEVPVWELESDSGTQIEPLIEQELKQLRSKSLAAYFQDHEDLRQDLFPQCGCHDFDPSVAGIVRSFEVRIVDELEGNPAAVSQDPRLSALVLLLAVPDVRQVEQVIKTCETLPAPATLTYVWIPKRGLAELVEPIRRYLVLSGLLKQQAAGEGVVRRLRNELDKTRRELRKEIRERLGRVALERDDVAIRRIGDPDEQVKATSWHGFTDELETRVQALYPKEIQVRAMNANRLYNVGDRKISRIENLLANLLHFDDLPPMSRNDLLGENSESSELSALIDGTLGVYTNGLLHERHDGWHLKLPDEAEGAVGELLRLIRDQILDKRRKLCEFSELRAMLMAPPFGLPTSVIPIFTAVAIRQAVSRLKWANRSEPFESSLWDASCIGTDLKLRFDNFKRKQLDVLDALRRAMRLPLSDATDAEDQARETLSKLRSYYKELPDAVRHSSKLSLDTRKLFETLKRPGLDAQDVADAILETVRGAADIDQMVAILQGIFDAVAMIRDERLAVMRQVIAPALQVPEQKRRIIDTLSQRGDAELVQALERVDQDEAAALSEVSQLIVGKPLDQCSDIEIGRLSGDLARLLERAGEPVTDPEPVEPLNRTLEISAEHTLGLIPNTVNTAIDDSPLDAYFQHNLSVLVDRYRESLDTYRMIAILLGQITQLRQSGALEMTENL
ncbi:hypothetical protein [uncultured Thiocystis sp.]|jgi:hypothetical protein|uniref:hypothetical protein n=1 Tax=uncultured Thiocystis sp. TaxID=1202134 RepID=UPI0025CBE4D7|nr:hypothetical protein [uncultured Thiocystis sp.]